jgi:hypothetical protein
MIHNTCPCCEVSRPPHCDDCTFAVDCPEACADFDYVANLRLTDAERQAIRGLAPRSDPLASLTVTLTPGDRKVFHGLLERTAK